MTYRNIKFWMVKGAGPSSAIHETREIAENEAERLARLNPGERFFVMEAIAYHIRTDTRRVDLSDPMTWDQHVNDDGIPF